MAVTRAADRLVAAGMRGLIAVSEDGGRSWMQSASPVQSDLLDVVFSGASSGWIVGHDGVVLKTDDGGKEWVKRFDGRAAAKILPASYNSRLVAGEAALKPYIDQLALDYKAGPSLPFLSIWTSPTNETIAVGAFGLAIRTVDDGRDWQPILEKFENPQFLHLNQIVDIGGDLYVAAEKGTIFRRVKGSDHFSAITTGYGGSFFGLVGGEDMLLAHGLHGTVYRSLDRGDSWSSLSTPLRGTITSSTSLAGARFALVSAIGEIAIVSNRGEHVRLLGQGQSGVLTGVCVDSSHKLVVSGLNGIRTVTVS